MPVHSPDAIILHLPPGCEGVFADDGLGNEIETIQAGLTQRHSDWPEREVSMIIAVFPSLNAIPTHCPDKSADEFFGSFHCCSKTGFPFASRSTPAGDQTGGRNSAGVTPT